MRKGFGLKVFILFIMVIFTGVLCGFTEKSDQRLVKVGYVPNDGFIHENDNGTYDGYMSEYMELLSYYGEWQCEYVEGTLEECLTWLAEGKIDIFPGMCESEVREGITISDLPLTQEKDSIYMLNDGKVAAGNYESLQDMRVGYVDGASLNEDFFETNRLACEFVTYDSMESLSAALEDRQVNAAMGMFCNDTTDMKLIARLNPRAIYIGFHSEDTQLKEQVEAALEKVSMEMPELMNELKEKYSDSSTHSNSVILSQIEQEWLTKNPTLRIAYVREDIPNEYRNEEGVASGINVEILQKIFENVGLISHWIPVENVQEGIAYLENGLVDAVAGINGDVDMVTETGLENLFLTESYRKTSYSILGRKEVSLTDVEKPPVFVLQKGDINGINFVHSHYPLSEVILSDSEEELYNQIKSGKGDATVVSASTEEYYLLKYGGKINCLSENYMEASLCVAVGQGGSNQLLLSILDHGIRHLAMDEVNMIVMENSTLQKEYTFWMNVKKNRIPILAGIAVMVGIIVCYMILHRRYQNARFWKAVYIDAVTERDNYEKMLMDIEKIFEEGRQTEYAVCYMDIVKFKNINENFGYAEGNRLLKLISDTLEENKKDGEYFSRVSADRFVYFMKDKEQTSIIKRINMLENHVAEENRKLEITYPFKLLVGIYLINEAEDKMSAFDKANIARKSIKDREINIAVYDEKMNERILKEREIEAIMEKALNNQEFLVYLQPRVDIRNSRIVGAEALVRWQRTNSEFLYPGSFIPLFERNGFIKNLDFYIYEKVCRLIRTRLDVGKKVVPISLNVSRLHLVGDDFLKKFNKIVHNLQIPEKYLELELTESLLVEDPTVMIDTVNQLKANSYCVSIDDFGSGYSSLNILKQLHFDVLKIDKEFLRADGFQEKDVIILRSVIQMAKALEMKVLIEGIETKEQADLLCGLGCDYAQGYYFAKPMPMQDFIELLDKQEAEFSEME